MVPTTKTITDITMEPLHKKDHLRKAADRIDPFRPLYDLLEHCSLSKARTIAVNDFGNTHIPIRINIQHSLDSHCDFSYPSPFNITESVIRHTPALQPPLFNGPWQGATSFTGHEWADLFDDRARHLSKLPQKINHPPARPALRREPDRVDFFEGFLARGQRTKEVQEQPSDQVARTPSLWRVISMLKAGNFLGCLVADNYCGGGVEEDSILRSELVTISVLLLKQLRERRQHNIITVPPPTTTITFTDKAARVLQSRLTLRESEPPRLDIVMHLNIEINLIVGNNATAQRNWGKVLSWVGFEDKSTEENLSSTNLDALQ